MTFDLVSARGWVVRNEVFAARKHREGDIAAAHYFANLAAVEQAKIDSLIEAKALARELAESDSSIADDVARLWYLLDRVIPETDILDVIETDVLDEAAVEPDE